ncbi:MULTISPECIES: MATE family efflux transporter [Carnobacterium]|uniref:Multidrug export protein MepA n=1 Tax=Carnobacterium antarcticum TaxID=2126436 RepID=A0ABW4NM85_9LACT|nr:MULTISPECIES: MATE family efflux transporter [unclassified Carnobacterium]ALV21612.1 Multi antimicrobial extrusion protein (Na(+)/drug antiporter), MATE family of MDR efflux pumps [Carnobacterium sp. CP1]
MVGKNKLETEKISTLLIEFSVPAMIGMFVNAVYNIVDRIFIGNTPGLGSLGLAAASITYPITLVMIAFGLMVGVGGSTRFSISLGRKETEKAQHYLGNGVALAIIMGLSFTILGNIFIEPILRNIGASEAVLPYATDYLSIILYGAVFQCLAMCMNNFSRADGNPRISMISMLIGAGFNIVFDYILIVRLGWGMKGAAYATIGGQFLSVIWQLAYFTGNRSNVRLVLGNMKLKLTYVREILTTGIPAFLLQIANSALNFIINASLVVYGGDVAISVAGIVTSAVTLIIMSISGLTQGLQPIVSYNTGADRIDRVKQALKLASIAGFIITTTGFLVIQLFPEFVVRLFNQEPEVVALGIKAIRIWTIAFPLVGLQIVWSNYFQAIGEVRLASFLNLARQLVFLVPLILILSSIFGLYGIYAAVPLADLLAFLVSFFFIRKRFPKSKILI